MVPSVGKASFATFRVRLVSAAIAVPPVIAAIHFGAPWFELLLAVATVVMALEWWRLCRGKAAWLLGGAAYIAVPILCLAWVRADPAFGRETVYWLFLLVWATDTGAFLVGSTVGGPKLAPSISPAKTWSGFLGGTACAAIVGGMVGWWAGAASMAALVAASAGMGVISQGGDLAESWVKRRFGVKDTGTIMPGHGGLLDRVDGLLPAAVATAALGAIGRGSVLAW